jgi:hypothetical protein
MKFEELMYSILRNWFAIRTDDYSVGVLRGTFDVMVTDDGIALPAETLRLLFNPLWEKRSLPWFVV